MYRQQLCSKSLISRPCIRSCADPTIVGFRPICPALRSVAECFTGVLPASCHLADDGNPVFAGLGRPLSDSRSHCITVNFFPHRWASGELLVWRSRLTGVVR